MIIKLQSVARVQKNIEYLNEVHMTRICADQAQFITSNWCYVCWEKREIAEFISFSYGCLLIWFRAVWFRAANDVQPFERLVRIIQINVLDLVAKYCWLAGL